MKSFSATWNRFSFDWSRTPSDAIKVQSDVQVSVLPEITGQTLTSLPPAS